MDAVSQQNGGYEKWRELYHELLPLYSISHISSPSPLLCLAREPGPLLELLEDAERSMVSQRSPKTRGQNAPTQGGRPVRGNDETGSGVSGRKTAPITS
ncbi:hypothetical protein SERLADRAFT_480181 [Serpula lacrymans var. lacrymans S7.9]|uniref:Uncharacterized protein n=1 Tax=Serpula lacrymans var. lacrymans (strain S7.9) TaxID=578457 RepID=F8PCS9_SERL9|nr:uncharacterized protein SERLADRAFT_480181 [Serpula lacrymans var. lacrymans S7.9]EGO19028.1 hypothetical protein SERLADRAFT_480181 [Serpula lacrymans var. lacrymans S7.9]